MEHPRGSGLLAFLGGMAAGALLGVLLAPRSGKETRERLMKRFDDARDDVGDLINDAKKEWAKARGKAADAAHMTKEEVEDLIRFMFEEGKDLASRLRDDVEESADAAADRLRNAADHIRHGGR